MQLVSEQGYPACVHCGACCLSAPCGYGEARGAADVLKSGDWCGNSCTHAVKTGEIDGLPLMTCAISDFIAKQPGADYMPAFGAGCCRTLGNQNRQAIIQAIKDGHQPIWDKETA